MNPTQTPTAAPTAKASTLQTPSAFDDNRPQQTTMLDQALRLHRAGKTGGPIDKNDPRVKAHQRLIDEYVYEEDKERPRSLQYLAKRGETAPIRKAARLLLREDETHRAGDGVGGFQWIDGELCWVAQPAERKLHRYHGTVYCQLLPESIELRIGNKPYALHMCNGWIKQSGEQHAFGMCFFDHAKIIVSNINPPAYRLAVAWHEIMHAIFTEYSEVMGNHDLYNEEQVCDFIGFAMPTISPLKYAEIAAFLTGSEFAYPAPPASA